MKKHSVIVVGGGPAGLMAAGNAAKAGAQTWLLEKMKRTGLKLCITGKGRCNITNIAEISDFISHFGSTGPFLHQAFSRFFNTDLMEFLNELDLELVTERGGRVFPASGKAPDVHRALLHWVRKCGVRIRSSAPVEELIIKDNRIAGVVSSGKEYLCDSLILATGGASYPATGSNGDGYGLAITAGHKIVTARQALVPLETAGKEVKRMAGLNLRNIRVHLYINGKKKREEFGELSFTDFGVTGPTVLSMSGQIVDSLRDGDSVTLSLDLKPGLDEKKLDARIERDISSRGHEHFRVFLRGLLPAEMVPVCLEAVKISPGRRVSEASAKEFSRLKNWLKDFPVEINGYRPFAEAIITAGGVDTSEVDPRTMESKIVKGLYFAGELLDIQADTGGYNLQASFSTGWLAGLSAGKS